MRRLSSKIQDLQNKLKREDKEKRENKEIGAVGVFGTDVYDKLLILKALRPSFPGAVFFTTDLDARLLHAKESRWTRNLVVVSGFGFELNTKFQRDILPFRSSYQTATYLATLTALDRPGGELKGLASENLNQERFHPRIFEIGRTRAIDLSPGESGLHPEKPYSRPRPSTHYLVGLFFMFLVTCLTIPSVLRFVYDRFADPIKRRNTILVVILAAALLLVMLRALPSIVREEPFLLIEGISVWPTEIIRGIAFLSAVVCIFWGKRSLQENETKLTIAFFPSEFSAPSLSSWPDDRKTGLVARCKDIFLYDLSAPTGRSNSNVEALWVDYCRQSRWKPRFCRVAFSWVLFLGLSLSLMSLFGYPHSPIRGTIAESVNVTILALLVSSFIVLLFFVVDAIKLCKHLADRFVAPTFWPFTTVTSERKKLGMKGLVPQEPPTEGDPAIDSWLDIKFFARLSEPVVKLIYYPFFILALIIAARSNLFDNWETPVGLLIVLSLSFGLAMYCAITLRLSAEKIRRANLSVLSNLLIAARGSGEDRAVGDQLEILIRRIEGIRDGAFAPFSQQPVFRGLIMPLGTGSLAFLDSYLAFL